MSDAAARSMPRVDISPATAADRDDLARILTQVFLADHTPYIPEAIDPAFVERYSRGLTDRAWPNMALARIDGVPAGMAYVEQDKIEAINVPRPFQRRGVGRALMAWAESRIAAAGFRAASIDTQEANAPARAFYESLGYRVTSRWPQTAFTRAPIYMITLSRPLDLTSPERERGSEPRRSEPRP